MEPSAPSRARGRPRAWDDKTDQNRIKSLDRAMEVLERLSEMTDATLSELAQSLGQPPASVYRVLVTLEARDFVEFAPQGQTWHIGPKAFIVGARFLRRTSVIERARPILRALMEDTGETANLGIERDGQVLFVAQAETHENIRAFFPPGTLSAMHASGIGKALLMVMPEEQVARIVARRGLEQFNARTIVDLEALQADLALSRARGYAVDAEEKSIGMRCIAAPVRNALGDVVAGISVSGPVSRMSEDKTEPFSAAVKRAAADLTAQIGGDILAGGD